MRMGSRTSEDTRAVMILLMAVALGACLVDDGSDRFQIALEFGSGNGGPRACTGACSAYPLRCAGRVAVRIADGRDPNTELDFFCSDTPANSATLCSLSALDFQFDTLPRGPARVEVALWRTDILENGRCLRRPFFDLQGEPLADTRPQPAVAGAVYFTVGDRDRVNIPMACIVPDQMSEDMCPPEQSVE